jgi:hypothetical protein
MKSLLIATAAFTLLGGAAFAQDSAPTAAPMTTPAQPAPAAGASDAASGMSSGADSSMSGAAAPSSAAAPSEGASTTASATGQSAYPLCSAKVHDNCVNRSQAMATQAMRHHKKQPAA